MQTQAFQKAAEFLNRQGFAKNLKSHDIIAFTAAQTGTLTNGTFATGSYTSVAGRGPLDSNGNMPSTTAAVIIGSAVVLPIAEAAGQAVPTAGTVISQLAGLSMHIVSVQGTPIIQRHLAFTFDHPGAAEGVAVGPLYGTGSGKHGEYRPEPNLIVRPGERIEQSLAIIGAPALGALSVTPQLLISCVVADKGKDE